MCSDLGALYVLICWVVFSDSGQIVVLFVGNVCHDVGRLRALICGHFCFDLVGLYFHTRRKLFVLVSVSYSSSGGRTEFSDVWEWCVLIW